jgi:exodeoxyribonuclease VII large subunit
LFEASVQGDGAASSIIQQLDAIAELRSQYDCVVIIRGGGSKTDLACFDQLSICQHVCQFPLPVITGIGHDRDESIADLVANTPLKTPTAVAQFLIDRAHGCEMAVDAKAAAIMRKVSMVMSGKIAYIDRAWDRIVSRIKNRLVQADARLKMAEARIEASSPDKILRRGYTYITIDGKPVTSAAQLKPGQKITTIFRDGSATSTVEDITINSK